MITIKCCDDESSEFQAAKMFAKIASKAMPNIADDNKVFLEILHSVQCYGQQTQDIDLVIFFGHYNGNKVEPQKVVLKRETDKDLQSQSLENEYLMIKSKLLIPPKFPIYTLSTSVLLLKKYFIFNQN